MSNTYLVTFKPLEPYAFGGARQFPFKGRKATQNDFEPYFIKTNPLPEQSTLFGTIRYLLLKQAKLIKEDFSYSSSERQAMASLVGEKSFSLLESQKQTFGKIESMSPLFILKDGHEKLIPNPFNNRSDEGLPFAPMRLSDKPVYTNYGALYLPIAEDYNAKKWYASGFYNLTAQRSHTESVFKTSVQTGNKIDSDEDGLFKKEVHCLEAGYEFAVYVTLDACLKDDIVSMGLKSSPFKVTVQQSEDTLCQEVQDHFTAMTPAGLAWSYFLSDTILEADYQHQHFSIMEEKCVRQMGTNWSQTGKLNGIQLKPSPIHLIKAGSISYGNILPEAIKADLSIAGYNRIIDINNQ